MKGVVRVANLPGGYWLGRVTSLEAYDLDRVIRWKKPNRKDFGAPGILFFAIGVGEVWYASFSLLMDGRDILSLHSIDRAWIDGWYGGVSEPTRRAILSAMAWYFGVLSMNPDWNRTIALSNFLLEIFRIPSVADGDDAPQDPGWSNQAYDLWSEEDDEPFIAFVEDEITKDSFPDHWGELTEGASRSYLSTTLDYGLRFVIDPGTSSVKCSIYVDDDTRVDDNQTLGRADTPWGALKSSGLWILPSEWVAWFELNVPPERPVSVIDDETFRLLGEPIPALLPLDDFLAYVGAERVD